MCYICSGGSGISYSSAASRGSISYSPLESMVNSYSGNSRNSGISYMAAEHSQRSSFSPMYESMNNIRKEVYANKDEYHISHNSSMSMVGTGYTNIDPFLDPSRPKTVFAGDASEIKDFVEETFEKLTGMKFPNDIIIRLVSKQEMEKLHPANVLGFAINRKHLGMISEIFVKKEMLDRVMLTLGHEIGHVLTRRLSNERDEEAKAFAFSIAWMKTIKEHNIANLATSIRLDPPAKNGIHDKALNFVINMLNRGQEAFEIYTELVKGILNIGGETYVN